MNNELVVDNKYLQILKSLVKKDISTIFALRKTTCRVGQEVKTPPFHGGITGSSPVRGTKKAQHMLGFFI